MNKVQDEQLSKNFWLYEFLRSQTATRAGGAVLEEQFNPPQKVIDNLRYLCKNVYQKARDFFNIGINPSSGYRSPALNCAVGGSDTSQHCEGEAGDVDLANELFNPDNAKASAARKTIEGLVQSITGKKLRKNCNANFYLFAYFAIYRYELDIDQVIHEYGEDGLPEWVHASASERKNKRQILIKRSGQKYEILNLKQALLLGC